MLILELYINWNRIEQFTALRIEGDTNPNSINKYKLNDGTVIKHRYGDGASSLAIKMLRHRLKKDKRRKAV